MSNFIVTQGLGGSLLITDGWGDEVSATPSSGVISASSCYAFVGKLVDCSRAEIPNLLLMTIGPIYSGNYTFMIQDVTSEEAWTFYLEGIHEMVAGVPTSYILYTFPMTSPNQYHFCKGNFSVVMADTDLYSYTNPMYLWGQSYGGTYMTGKIPLYVRRVG